MTVANAYALKIISWKGDCFRTLEFRGDQDFCDVHRAIQREFSFDDDHLWAFYMSGEFFDSDTEIGPSRARYSPSTKLTEVDLKPGMRIAYVFDMGDEHRHDIEVIGVRPAVAGANYPVAIERHGAPPPQYPPSEDDEWDEGDDTGEHRAADENEGDEDGNDADEGDDVEVGAISDASEQSPSDATPGTGEGENAEGEISPELAKVIAIADSLAEYLDGLEDEQEARAQPDDVRRALEALLALASEAEAFDKLEGELVAHDDRDLLNLVRNSLTAAVDESPKNEALVEVAVRWARLTGEFTDAVRAASALCTCGKVDEALAFTRGLEVRGPLVTWRRCLVADVLVRAHRFDEAEPELRSLLAERWLSRRLRRSTLAILRTLLTESGRRAEAEALERAERGRVREIQEEQAGTVRNAPKVGPNERCPCGSGKKYKRCCGA